MQELYGRNALYERRIQQLTLENEELIEERRRLQEDPEYLESIARKKFGIIKEGETIYKILPFGTPVKEVEAVVEEKPKTNSVTTSVKKNNTTTTETKKKSSSSTKKTSTTKN